MPYAEGRTYYDADSHLMELSDWLESYADPGIREKIRPLYLGGAGALAEDADRISRWANGANREGGHSNFVADYDSPSPIGRTLNRGESDPHSCNHAKVVLKWDGPGTYHVLTTYPECR